MQQFCKFIFVILILLCFPYLGGYSSGDDRPEGDIIIQQQASESERLYVELGLEGLIDFNIFDKAYTGYRNIEVRNKNVLSIIDFDQPSSKKRLFVLDIKNKKVLYNSYVSHGRNSGELYAKYFSNKNGSHKSSLGFYETENTYNGRNGYSLILNGLEKGINDQAKARAIVIHGADYCSPEVIASSGRLGRSFGCPSLPQELTVPIINTIKNGSLLFIYASNKNYLAQSRVLLPQNSFVQSVNSL